MIWVADRGFTSQKNRRALMQGGGGYIIGEKLRSGSAEVRAALSRQGRYAIVRDNMQVKEVSIGTDDRFVLCFNPAQAERDAAIRARIVAQLDRRDQGHRHADRGRTRQDRGRSVRQARAEAVPAHHPRRAAAHRQAEDQDRGEPGRQVPAALLRPGPVRRGHRPGLQAAAGSRARLARHEADPGPAPGLPPARGPDPRPRPAVLAGPAADPRRRDHHRARPGTGSAPSSSGCTRSPTPARPGPSARPPSRPSPSATS